MLSKLLWCVNFSPLSLTALRALWSVNLPAKVLSMAPMDYSQRGYQAVLLGLANSELHIYCEKFLVHVIKTEDIVTGGMHAHTHTHTHT